MRGGPEARRCSRGARLGAEEPRFCRAEPRRGKLLLGVLRRDHFLVRPLAESRVCTTASVAAHTMYEQPSPFELHEPEGVVDFAQAQFTQADARTVRVGGATMHAPTGAHRLQLEGARCVGYGSFVLAGVRDPQVIANLVAIEDSVRVLPFDRARAIKVTLPRTSGARGSGSIGDRDVYGAQQHAPLAGLVID